MNTATDVVLGGLCTGCGTCSVLCPEGAITIVLDPKRGLFFPRLDDTACTGCGRCLQVCAGIGVNRTLLAEELSPETSSYALLGRVRSCALGHASDDNVRSHSSSEGLVTAILIYALESGLIDGAVVTRFRRDHPAEVEAFVARTRDEIIEAAQSKYRPVPLNAILGEVLQREGKYAIVGLPCHIQGIRLAQQHDEILKSRVCYCLGLACHHAPSLLGTEYLVSRLGFQLEDVTHMDYRKGDWPGSMSVKTKNGDSQTVSYDSELYWGFLFQRFFFPKRCMMCLDKSSLLSDITFMDAWRQTNGDANELVVIRTERGERLMQSFMSSGRASLIGIPASAVADSLSLERTLRERSALTEILRRRGQLAPSDSSGLPSSFEGRMRARSILALNSISADRRLWLLVDVSVWIAGLVRRLKRIVRGKGRENAGLNNAVKSD